jgi:SAM-dependent methyltransferase
MNRDAPAQAFALVSRKLRGLIRAATNRTFRYQVLARLGMAKGTFQIDTTTGTNRYPEIFSFVQSALGADCRGRILSFGCASGEEVATLRGYFPKAKIKGVDINPGNIARCRRLLDGDADLSFEVAGSAAREPSGAYEAIFCMAVLRDGRLAQPGITRCDHKIKFEDFARVIADFERCLKPGGLLAIHHSNFMVTATATAAKLDVALLVSMPAATPIFGPDNRLIQGVRNPEAVFRKR